MNLGLNGLGHAQGSGRAQAEAALPALYTAALRLTGDAAQAEVLVESTYRTHAARGWRRRSARVRFDLLDTLYTTWRERHGSPVGAQATFRRGSGLEPSERPLSLDRVVAAVNALPDALWHPLWLCDNQDLSYEEIALLLGVSRARVAGLVSQARRELILTLRRDGGGRPSPQPESGSSRSEERTLTGG